MHEVWVLIATIGALGLVIASTVNTTTAIPEIASSLKASQTQLQWIADIYPLVLAALLLPAGAVLDRYERKRGLMWGMAILALSMLWSALVGSADELIISRALAGVGGALALPGTLATITSTVSSERRGQAVSFWAVGFMLGGLVGIVVGAAMGEGFWWGASFLVLSVLVAIWLVLVGLSVPETRDPAHAVFDPLGAVISCISVGALVLAVTEEPLKGWLNGLTLGGLAIGIIGLIAFIGWELHNPRPLLNLRYFRDRSFGTSTATLFVMFLADFGLFSLFFQWEAYQLGYGPLKSALGLLPETVAIVPIFPAAPMIARRFGRRPVISSGLALCAIGAFITAYAGRHGYWAVTISASVFWAGVGLAMGPSTEAIIEALPASEQGVASAVNDLSRELGAALGIAVVGSAFNAGYRNQVGHLLGHISGALTTQIKTSPASGLQAAHGLRSTVMVVHSGVEAGWHSALLVVSALMLIVAVFVAFRYPKKGEDKRRIEGLDIDAAIKPPFVDRPEYSLAGHRDQPESMEVST